MGISFNFLSTCNTECRQVGKKKSMWYFDDNDNEIIMMSQLDLPPPLSSKRKWVTICHVDSIFNEYYRG